VELLYQALTPIEVNKSQAMSHIKDDSPRKRAYSEAFAMILSERYREIINDQIPGSIRDQTELREIVTALKRISQGTFGACQVCDGVIGHEMLLRVPFTRQCLGCQQRFEHTLSA